MNTPRLTGFDTPQHLRSSVEPAHAAHHREHATRLLRELLDVRNEPDQGVAHMARDGDRKIHREEEFEFDLEPGQVTTLWRGNVIGETVEIAKADGKVELWGYTGCPAAHDNYQPEEWSSSVQWEIHAEVSDLNLRITGEYAVITGVLRLTETYET